MNAATKRFTKKERFVINSNTAFVLGVNIGKLLNALILSKTLPNFVTWMLQLHLQPGLHKIVPASIHRLVPAAEQYLHHFDPELS